MKILTILSLICFLAVAGLGWLAINHGSQFTQCAAALTGNVSCGNTHSVQMGIFHAQIFNGFSLAVLGLIALAIVALSFFLFIPAAFGQALRFQLSQYIPQFAEKLTAWLVIKQEQEPAKA